MQNGVNLNQTTTKPLTLGEVAPKAAERVTSPTPTTTQTRDPFLEGFYSTEDKPETERKTYLQHRTPVVEKVETKKPEKINLPYRPSVQGQPKITQYGNVSSQNQTYKPRYITNQNLLNTAKTNNEEDEFLQGFNRDRKEENKWNRMLDAVARGEQTIPTQYSNTSNDGASQKPKQSLQESLEEHVEDLQNFGGELWKIAKDLPPHVYAAILTTMATPKGSLPRIIGGKVLENEVKKIHYERNKHNINLPEGKKDVTDWKWKKVAANCHQFTAPDGQRYIKFVSPDGKREVIFDSKWNVITADEDKGTYNYADPDLLLAHGFVDVLPWLVYGNSPEDTTKWYERVKGLFNFEN